MKDARVASKLIGAHRRDRNHPRTGTCHHSRYIHYSLSIVQTIVNILYYISSIIFYCCWAGDRIASHHSIASMPFHSSTHIPLRLSARNRMTHRYTKHDAISFDLLSDDDDFIRLPLLLIRLLIPLGANGN